MTADTSGLRVFVRDSPSLAGPHLTPVRGEICSATSVAIFGPDFLVMWAVGRQSLTSQTSLLGLEPRNLLSSTTLNDEEKSADTLVNIRISCEGPTDASSDQTQPSGLIILINVL